MKQLKKNLDKIKKRKKIIVELKKGQKFYGLRNT